MIENDAITIVPDLERRCPVVDPDDHHLFISIGCAVENLVLAAHAHGMRTATSFDHARDAVRIELTPGPARESEWFNAISSRQSTRGEYDGRLLSLSDLKHLESAAAFGEIRTLFLVDAIEIERVADFALEGNTAQMRDRAFVAELKSWMRFNGTEATRTGDGLFTKCTGNPELPNWLGRIMFDLFATSASTNDAYLKQIRSSSGIAVFSAPKEGKSHWVEVGRAFERFALQATALDIRTAHINMPIEVVSLRQKFAGAVGLGNSRPDLVVRFGRGPTMPRSLRRPVDAVLV